MVKQIRVLWTAAGGAGGETAMHFLDSASTADILTDVNAFLLALQPRLASTTSAVASPNIRTLDTSTGVLVNEVGITPPAAVVGTGGATAVPNASQGLIRLRTTLVINRRFLQGRIYVPGMGTSTMLATGEVNPAAVTSLAAAGNVLVLGARSVVWHRPVAGSGGTISPISSASGWTEFAVQRRRRS